MAQRDAVKVFLDALDGRLEQLYASAADDALKIEAFDYIKRKVRTLSRLVTKRTEADPAAIETETQAKLAERFTGDPAAIETETQAKLAERFTGDPAE